MLGFLSSSQPQQDNVFPLSLASPDRRLLHWRDSVLFPGHNRAFGGPAAWNSRVRASEEVASQSTTSQLLALPDLIRRPWPQQLSSPCLPRRSSAQPPLLRSRLDRAAHNQRAALSPLPHPWSSVGKATRSARASTSPGDSSL